MREHWNDVPGDIAGEDADTSTEDLSVDNPDLNPDALVDEVMDGMTVVGPTGQTFAATDQSGGDYAGADAAGAAHEGSTVDPNDLLEDTGNEGGTPGASKAA